ncbi:MAG: sulfatase-like hydrolase/transferase [Candidatus Aminicenantaceae bacterium]
MRLKNFFLGIFPGFVLCILFPFTVYIPHQEDFNYSLEITLPYLGIAVIWFGLILVIVALRRYQQSKIFIYIFYAGIFFLLKDIFAPIQAGGLIGLDEFIPIHEPLRLTLIELLILISVIIAAIFIPKKIVQNYFVPIIIAFCVVQTTYIIVKIDWSVQRISNDQKKIVEKENFFPSRSSVSSNYTSTKGNVYMICLDSFVGKIFQRVVKEGNLESAFSGFTVFPNNRSNYAFTYPSISSIMNGSFYSGGRMSEWIYGWKKGGIINNFADAGYVVWQYSSKTWLHDRTTHFKDPKDLKSVYRSAKIKRFLLISNIWLLKVVPTALKKEVFYKMRSLEFSYGPGDLVARSLDTLWEFASDEKKRPSTGQFVYIHAYIPHKPYIYDENCSIKYPPTSIISQSACSLRPIVQFIKQLKLDGKFDNATIIIFSDHGSYAEELKTMKISMDEKTKEQIRHISLRENPLSLELHTSTLLLFKPPNAQNKPLKVSDLQTQSVDIAATLSDITGVLINHKVGISVFRKDFPSDREINIYIGYLQRKNNGKVMVVGSSLFKGEMNHFSYSPVRGWKILPNIKFKW